MAQIFHRSTNTLSKLSIFGAVFVLGGSLWGFARLNRSDYATLAHVAREQPVPFSHRHHAGELGIDCRYCHTSVEQSAYANIPPTQICMNCHSQIWADSPMLEPVRGSYQSGESIRWIKIHDLPDFVYFNHSIHIHKGIGCATCHGRVDEMNLTWQEASLHMEWCLDCHRNPQWYVRPREEVFNMAWKPEVDQSILGPALVVEYNIESRDDCAICHR
jgi:hypothetical protein